MITLLLILAIAVVILIVLIWAIDQTGIPYPASMLLKVLVVLIAIIIVAQQAGFSLHGLG